MLIPSGAKNRTLRVPESRLEILRAIRDVIVNYEHCEDELIDELIVLLRGRYKAKK
jgi:hypothetical protein